MAVGKKISDLTTITSISASNYVEIEVSGVSKKFDASDFARLSQANAFTNYQTITLAGYGLAYFNSTHADGGYVAFQRSGLTKGYLGNSKAVSNGTLDDIELYSNAALLLTGTTVKVNGVASTDFARLSQSNTFTGASQTITANGARYVVNTTDNVNGYFGVQSSGVSKSYIGSGLLNNGSIADIALRAVNGGLIFSGNDGVTAHFQLSAAGILTTPNSSAAEVGYKGYPLARTITASSSIALADSGKFVITSGSTAGQTFTLDSTCPQGTEITFVNNGSASWSIASAGIINWGGSSGTRTVASGGIVKCLYVGSNAWYVSGAGIS